MTKMPAFIGDPESHLTVTFDDGFSETLYVDDSRFQTLLTALKAQDWATVRSALEGERVQFAATIKEMDSSGVVLEHGIVYVNGEPLHNTLTDRIVRLSEAGFNVKSMTNFLANLMENSSMRAVKELYGFLEKSSLPITEDGHFLAYKKIKENWTDCHTGTISNRIGNVVEMPRNRVNEDKDQTCSDGLHFCSREYLKSFGGARTVVVKINPRDVVSIPSDYNNAKGRCCRYEVMQEIDSSDSTTTLEEIPVAATKKAGATTSTVVALDLETGAVQLIYDTVEAAAADLSLTKGAINRVLRGDRKSTGGFAWAIQEITPTEYDLTVRSAVDDFNQDDWNVDEDNESDSNFEEEETFDDDLDDDEWPTPALYQTRTSSLSGYNTNNQDDSI